MNTVNLTLRLTLLNLLLRPIGTWYLRPVFLGLAAFALLLPGQLRQPLVWLALTVLATLRVLLDWPMADNHAYLLCYWCLAVTLALISHDPRACLAFNGRLLIGFVFTCATLWKLVLSPDYLDGRFFRVMLISDPRFAPVTHWAGGFTPELLELWRQFVTQHVDGRLVGMLDTPQQPVHFWWLAYVMTWWTVLLEASIAVAFLFPLERGISKWRDALLLLFCAMTYAVAPVEGFGWLLLAMGVAQCGTQQAKKRGAYLAVFGLVLLYREVPWAQLLAEGQAP